MQLVIWDGTKFFCVYTENVWMPQHQPEVGVSTVASPVKLQGAALLGYHLTEYQHLGNEACAYVDQKN